MPLTIHSIATTQAAVLDLWCFSGKEEAISLFCCLLLLSLLEILPGEKVVKEYLMLK